MMISKFKGEFLFLFLISAFAVITTTGYTIAWGLVPLFYAFKTKTFFFNYLSLKKNYLVIIIFFLVFCINLLAVFSFNDFFIKIPHPDFHYYLKVASFFNQTGIENNFTAKTVLIQNLNIATPYRFFDTWLLAFLIKVLPYSDLIVLQIFYLPVLWFMVSYSVCKNIDFVKNNYIKILLSITFLFIFGDSFTNFIFLKSSIAEVCVVSYPKLAIFFCVFIYFFRAQLEIKSRHDSILFLALLPILIQTAFPLYIFIYLYLIVHYKYFFLNTRVVISIFLSSIYFVVFYGYNSYLSSDIFQIGQFQFVKSFSEYFHRLISIVFGLFKTKLLFFVIIVLVLILTANKDKKKVYSRMLILAIGILISTAIIYALFPSSPNSYQLMTNFTFPVFITLVFFIWIDVVISLQKYFILNYFFLLCFVTAGIYNQYSEYGFFNVKDKFSSINDKQFVSKAQIMLKKIKNPIGLTYWSKKNITRNKYEYFDQYGTMFLIKLGAKFDVVCLSALQSNPIDYSDTVSKYYSAISIFKRIENTSNLNTEEEFYNKYGFEYLISDLSINFLPKYIKKDIIKEIYDTKSKIYFYQLK